MKRLLVLLVVAATVAIAACDRVVDLTPAPDAHAPDGGAGNDAAGDGGLGSDGGFDGGLGADGGGAPDA